MDDNFEKYFDDFVKTHSRGITPYTIGYDLVKTRHKEIWNACKAHYEQQVRELEAAKAELQAENERLKEYDIRVWSNKFGYIKLEMYQSLQAKLDEAVELINNHNMTHSEYIEKKEQFLATTNKEVEGE